MSGWSWLTILLLILTWVCAALSMMFAAASRFITSDRARREPRPWYVKVADVLTRVKR